MSESRPVALVTGASRRAGIGAAVAAALAREGWNVATTFWSPYDAGMPWGDEPGDREWLERKVREAGAKAVQLEANLEAVTAPASVFDAVEHALGGITALVLCHVVDIERDTLATTLEDFDRAMAVNVRASWLLVREFGLRYKDKAQQARGRVVAITSDHFVGSLAYGPARAR